MRSSQRLALMAHLGPELVPDPDFNVSGSWSAGSGWVVANGVATATAVANGILVQIPVGNRPPVAIGDRHRWEIVVDAVTLGGFGFSGTVGAGTVGPTLSTPGVYRGIVVATGASAAIVVAVRAVGSSTGVITRFSLRKVLG
jgi:hypothetical protein